MVCDLLFTLLFQFSREHAGKALCCGNKKLVGRTKRSRLVTLAKIMGSPPPSCGAGGRSGSTVSADGCPAAVTSRAASLLSLFIHTGKAEGPGAVLAPGPMDVCSVSGALRSFGGSACSVLIPFHGAARAHGSSGSWWQQCHLLALGSTSGSGESSRSSPKEE